MRTPDITRRGVLKSLGVTAGIGTLAGPATANGEGRVAELVRLWATTYKYTDPAKAYSDGYFVPDGSREPIPLDEVTEEGHAVCGMGYHFINPTLLGTADWKRPQALVYGVDGDELTLGAVEYVVPKAGPYAADPPDLFDHDGGDEVWHTMGEGEGAMWTLHVWVHTENENGKFAGFNPDSTFNPDGCTDPREGGDHGDDH